MSPAARILLSGRAMASRGFHTSARRMNDSAPLPAKKPMGAFRGGLFGFLFGTALSGSAVYSYLVKEYRAANDLLTEDIYTLQTSVHLLTNHVKALEQRGNK
ncbi:hypothetical protein PT974_11723 [Cladobotryum mycophilum]|uniref:Uncharacterized protein n=1 Tax=Cladobotryum mycophilum TaxID=491253 RepID=A0ABR0S7E0_9HYPO